MRRVAQCEIKGFHRGVAAGGGAPAIPTEREIMKHGDKVISAWVSLASAVTAGRAHRRRNLSSCSPA
jgi:hypothetical protein